MATTTTIAGKVNLLVEATAALGGDSVGSQKASVSADLIWDVAGGTAPTISGFFKGTAVCAAGDWLLAHATDPLQSMGDATYQTGFTVASTKLKLLFVRNEDTINSITIARGATAGLPIFDAANDSITLAPGDYFLFYKKAGTAALTTTSNDKLTISVSAGSPNATVVAWYGP